MTRRPAQDFHIEVRLLQAFKATDWQWFSAKLFAHLKGYVIPHKYWYVRPNIYLYIAFLHIYLRSSNKTQTCFFQNGHWWGRAATTTISMAATPTSFVFITVQNMWRRKFCKQMELGKPRVYQSVSNVHYRQKYNCE